ncbi:hypothetical protein [Mesorhizobium hawassense]|nr:hypothetical protein [Mesorhizobium hawassense]
MHFFAETDITGFHFEVALDQVVECRQLMERHARIGVMLDKQ